LSAAPPSAELIVVIVEMKRRNPRFGCMRIAQQIAHAFGVEIDKDIVRRVLAKHYRPDDSGPNGPSWLTFIAHAKDSLWGLDLFRCESILLRSHPVMLVMDVCTRRLVGFGVERANIDGVSVCRMFNRAIAGQRLPKHVSTDHDPLYSASTGGWLTCASSQSMRSNRFRTHRFRIRSLNG
jgi:putative transposase